MIEMKELDTPIPYSFPFGDERPSEQSEEDVYIEEENGSKTQQTDDSEPVDRSLKDAWVNMVIEIQKAGSKSDSYADKSLAAANEMFRIAHDNSENINLQRGIAHVLNQEAQSIRYEREELENSAEK